MIGIGRGIRKKLWDEIWNWNICYLVVREMILFKW